VLAGEAASDRRKEVLGNVIPYEILLMLDPELPEDRASDIVARARELIEKGGGTWANQEVWGRRKLAYEIGHKGEGAYHLLTFSAEPETLDEISRVLKITDGVMRHMAVRQVAGSRPQGSSAGAPSVAPEREPVVQEAE
jgi:small subunit ribosomal protein S6